MLFQDAGGAIYGTTEYSAQPPYRGTVFAIRGLNQAPIASVSAPATTSAGASCVAAVTLDASGSSDPDGDADLQLDGEQH
jgi:hypothetical protein